MNTVPTQDKTQSTSSTGTYENSNLHLNVGDTVYYQIEVTDGTGTDANIVLTDAMTEGLTFDQDSIVVYAGSVASGNELALGTEYTVTGKTARGFTLTLLADYVKTIDTSAKVFIRYSATINQDAVVDSATGNSNASTLNYSAQTSADVGYVETYEITLKKIDGTNALSGAKFNLFTTATGGTALTLESDTTGYYLSTAAGASAEIDAGEGTGVNIRGLAPGSYYFEETVAPSGYNKLNERKPVTVTAGATAAKEITVVNNAGSVLPTTGGIGTTIFFVVGAILVIGAGVVLVTRRRMDSEK